MIVIYQIDMTTKLGFFIFEYFLDSQEANYQSDSNARILRAVMRSILFSINSLFLMSLHMFV